MRLTERVAGSWYGHGRPGDDAVCVGVIAALTLMVQPAEVVSRPKEAAAAKQLILDATPAQFADLLAQVWATFAVLRPELVIRCGPFAAWLDCDPRDKNTIEAACAVARTALKEGLWDHDYSDQDILGVVYSGMRPDKARQARGEYFSPPSLCRLMGDLLIAGSDVGPGERICEPAAGTGGMFLGLANAMRAAGGDPEDHFWYGADISAVSVAGLAVNCHVWHLGQGVVLAVANSLAEPDWPARAAQEQDQALEDMRLRVQCARMLALLNPPEPAPEPAPEPPAPERRPLPGPIKGEPMTLF
jgi:hypothetical protein